LITRHFALLVAVVALSGCLQPMSRYHLASVAGTRDERTAALARAFVAAEAEPGVIDPMLGMVATDWQAPFGSSQGSQWTRRWVAVIADSGEITIRAEIKVCRTFQGCSDLNQQGSSYDVEALDTFARKVAGALNTQVTVVPSGT
jgi:hypothetical protein